MERLKTCIEQLAANPICGYHPDSMPATEPTAIAAMALLAVGEYEPAAVAAQWLVELQAHRGSIGISVDQGEPCWPTAMALIVWSEMVKSAPSRRANSDQMPDAAIARGVEWLQSYAGTTQPPQPDIGHDPSIVGWPWVNGTHSWVEPTAWSVLAMKALAMHDHERCRSGVRLLLDRQLPDGGCNYGNTIALGQETLPHLQPTALALLALQGEEDDPRLRRSLDFLQRKSQDATGLSSICYAALAQRAHGKKLPGAADRIGRELERAGKRAGSFYGALAILALSDLPYLIRVGRQSES